MYPDFLQHVMLASRLHRGRRKPSGFLLLPLAVACLVPALGSAQSAPVADFTVSPNPAACMQAISFDASGSAGSIESYEWDFGDGETAIGVTATHAYGAFGDYTATLTVTDSDSLTDTMAATVSVNLGNSAPVASFTITPSPSDIGEDVILDAASSHDPDEGCGDSIVSYEWDLDNDGAYNGPLDRTGPVQTIPWQLIELAGGVGAYPMTLRVTDSLGATATISATHHVCDFSPVAAFVTSPNPAGCGQQITFDASGSYSGHPEHSIVLYEWDLDGDGAYDATGETTTHAYSSFGEYTVTLRVTDSLTPPRSDTLWQSVTVSLGNSAPIADFTISPSPSLVGRDILLDATASSDPDEECGDSIVSYEWDVFGDGAYNGPFDLTGVSATIPGDWLSAPGSFAVVLRVTDSFGATDELSMTHSVRENNPPVADFTVSPSPSVVGEDLILDASSSSDSDEECGDSIVSYEWDLDNDGEYDLAGVSVTVSWAEWIAFNGSAPGAYPVSLRVTDSFGATHQASGTHNVCVLEPFADFTVDANPAACGQELTFDASASYHGHPAFSIVSYEWDLNGDGTYDATGLTTTRAYSSFGEYAVTLRVTDSQPLPVTDTMTVLVDVNQGNNPPVPCFTTSPSPSGPGEDILLDATASFDPNEGCGDSIISYEWDLDGDGAYDGPFDLTGVLATIPGTWITGSGSLTVTLRVTDGFGVAATVAGTHTVYDPLPVAAFTATVNPDAFGGLQVIFDASDSYHGHPDHSIVSYEWDFENDGVYDATGETVVHTYSDSGAYTVRLLVIDSQDPVRWDMTSQTVTVSYTNSPPVPSFTVSPSPSAPQKASF